MICECGAKMQWRCTNKETNIAKYKCPVCGTPLKLYQRITGYLRCIDNYNDGKKAEFDERVQLKPED